MENSKQTFLRKATPFGMLITLGIVFGDIGTSPLYVMKAIIGQYERHYQGLGMEMGINPRMVLGGLSAVFWTLTFQTTLKYVILTLRADNNGEGGILSLFALVRRHRKWLVVPAMVGAGTLLADGMITPAISVTSAIEGLRLVDPQIKVIPIVIAILIGLFLFQRFGTKTVGYLFGPITLVWFSMLAIVGGSYIVQAPEVLKAFNPIYAIEFLRQPFGFWLLGAVFLCTTGAEALYSDLGHCGRGNIRVTWTFVKAALLTNYFGQGAWLLSQEGHMLGDRNPFFIIVPEWFLLPSIIIATMATIIASQALISGSYTLISEAIRLNLWPKVEISYPTDQRGQIYLPSINMILMVGCIGMVLFFRSSEHMEAAYGLAITLTMLMTTLLLWKYLQTRRWNPIITYGAFVVFLTIELSFLVANLDKIPHGGWVTLVIGSGLFALMWIWFNARKIKNRYTEFDRMERYLPIIRELSEDNSIPRFATNLVFLTSADRAGDIETKIIYSIFNKQPKRADVYYFVHVNFTDEPYTLAYKIHRLVPEKVFKIEFDLGFRVEPRITLFFRKAVEELSRNGEVNIVSRYDTLKKHNIVGDFRFVVIERVYNYDPNLSGYEQFLMTMYNNIKNLSLSEESAFGLDLSLVTTEKVPLVTNVHSQPIEGMVRKE